MKRAYLQVMTAWLILVSSMPGDQAAWAQTLPAGPRALCLPGIYLNDPVDCLPAGPSDYRTQLAEEGIILPLAPLPAVVPSPGLIDLPYRYGEVRTPNAPVYGSVEDAQRANRKAAIRRIDSSFSYISYTDEAVIDGKRFYMVEYGSWMTAADVSRVGSASRFQGLEFKATPLNAFGWILAPVESKRTPGSEIADFTGRTLNRYEVVQIYATQKVGELEWYQIGPEEWIPEKAEWQRSIGRVIPNTRPPVGVTGDRWIEVNLFEQTLAVYDHYQLVFATLVASGIEPFWTRPGLFQIAEKLETTPMRGAFEPDQSDAYYLEDVPWTMYFDQARALHGAYWHNGFGFPRSHGCVNLSVGDAHWIFDWANAGEWVYVWDPSGKTPTDPALYTAGAP